MAEHPMETTFRTALWPQFGAAIDMLGLAGGTFGLTATYGEGK